MFYCVDLCPVATCFSIMEMPGSTGTDVKRGFYIKRGAIFPFLQSDGFDLFHKCLCVLHVV